MSYQNRMRQMQAASELEQQNAFFKAIVDLITENEMLKRQLKLIKATNQKENIKQSGVSESRKRLLINRIDQLNLIYGQDKTIFKLASEME